MYFKGVFSTSKIKQERKNKFFFYSLITNSPVSKEKRGGISTTDKNWNPKNPKIGTENPIKTQKSKPHKQQANPPRNPKNHS